MKRSTPHVALGIVLAVAGSMTQTARAQTNETWGGQGGASSWQTGSAKPTASAVGRIATGGESSWGAGKGSVATRGAPGGVWSDGTTLYTVPVPAPGAKAAAGVSSPARPVGFTSLGAVPSRSYLSVTPGGGQAARRPVESHAATGAKSPFGPQFAPGKTGGISRRTSGGRPGATTGRRQLGISSRSGTSRSGSTAPNQGLESPLQSDSAMDGLTGSTSSLTLSLEPHSSLDSSSY
jgi:hypothetical protein